MQKIEQVVNNFYLKAAQLVVTSRVTHLSSAVPAKPWFNLAINESPDVAMRVQPWISDGQGRPSARPVMVIDILLSVSAVEPHLRSREAALILTNSATSEKIQLDASYVSKKKAILLERWELELGSPVNPHTNVQQMYESGLVYFRALYTFLRTLPAFRLSRRMSGRRGRRGTFGSGGTAPPAPISTAMLNDALRMQFAISPSPGAHEDVQGLDVPILGWHNDSTTEAIFPGQLETPLGTFRLRVRYRTTCSYEVVPLAPSMSYGVADSFVSVNASPPLRSFDSSDSSAMLSAGSSASVNESPAMGPLGTAVISPPRPVPPRSQVWATPTPHSSLQHNSPPSQYAPSPLFEAHGAVLPPLSPPSATSRMRSDSARELLSDIHQVGSHKETSQLSEFISLMSKPTDELIKSVSDAGAADPEEQQPSMAASTLSERLDDYRSLQSELEKFHLLLSQHQSPSARSASPSQPPAPSSGPSGAAAPSITTTTTTSAAAPLNIFGAGPLVPMPATRATHEVQRGFHVPSPLPESSSVDLSLSSIDGNDLDSSGEFPTLLIQPPM